MLSIGVVRKVWLRPQPSGGLLPRLGTGDHVSLPGAEDRPLPRSAALAGISEWRARKWIAEGLISASQDGPRSGRAAYWRVPLSELDRCAEAKSIEARPAEFVSLSDAARAAHRDPDFVVGLLEAGVIRGERGDGPSRRQWRILRAEAAKIPQGFPRPNRLKRAA